MVNTNPEGYRRVNGSQRKLNGAVVAKLVRWNSGLENRPSAEFFPSFLWFSFALFSHDKYGTVDHSAWSLFEGPCLPDKEQNEMTLAHGSKSPSQRGPDPQIVLCGRYGRLSVIVLVELEIPVEIPY